MIWIPNQLIGASLASEVTLDCNTEAFPLSLNYWTKDDNYMIVSNDKFKTANSEKGYKVQMKLTIKNVDKSDFGIIVLKSSVRVVRAHCRLISGTYRCFAKNSLGSTQGSIRLYGKRRLSSPLISSDWTTVCLTQRSIRRRRRSRRPPESKVWTASIATVFMHFCRQLLFELNARKSMRFCTFLI